ncbi:hypothetical protein Goari_010518 [Gossypium aridum]|uniref:RNase H type-1 domain-containing protein n=1 Tax=Gossypium aridum TaxID=34290 RepID=A0A7J8Y0A2_GOSAI|nr:hypothetical protein [Gossypium aridum]
MNKHDWFVVISGLSGFAGINGYMIGNKTLGIDERCPSVVPYVKFNFDAAFNHSLNISSLGIVVRNHRGEIIVLKTAMHKKLASPFDTEGLACLQALLLGGIPHSVVDAVKRRCPREPD